MATQKQENINDTVAAGDTQNGSMLEAMVSLLVDKEQTLAGS